MTAREARLSRLDNGPKERGPRELGPRELAGYRVLRSLAHDHEGEVLLGHRQEGAAPEDAHVDTGRTVAIKTLPSSGTGWVAARRACAALERARGDHVVDLLDVDADAESIRLVLERLPRGDLAELLRVRQQIDAGEAVTVLAPIANALLRMHAAGVAHGKLSARSVLFRDDGSPTLIGFSRAELFEPGAPEVVLEQVAAVRLDRSAAVALAVTVLGRVQGSRARAARELISDIEGCDAELALPLLATRLFEVAAAMPIRFAPDAAEVEIAPSKWRAIPVGAPGEEPAEGAVGRSSAWGSAGAAAWAAAISRIVPEPLLRRVLDTVEGSPAAPVVMAVAAPVRRRWASWSPARRRAVVAIAAALVTVAGVMAVAPTTPGGSRTGQTSNPRATSTASDVPSAGGHLETGSPVATGDDPLAATPSLVTARDRCLSSLSLRCLELVDETGSSALSDDQAAIRLAQQGGELPDPLSSATGGPALLIERLGDSALVRLGQAASDGSLLLVKGDNGWRIRDVIPAGAASAPPHADSPGPTSPPSASGG